MGLLSPWFLVGLLALGLPLWLHLLRQFKRTPQPFSSLMFFEKQIQSSSKHRRLRYLTLLAIRLALLALLALLFTDPFINRSATAIKSRKLTVIAIDNSFSMRYRNRLADAKTQATQFVANLGGGNAVQVVALASRTTPLTQPELDKTVVLSAINAIEPTDEVSSYGEFTRALRVMEQSTGLALDVHLFTDAQQTSMPTSFSDLQLGPHTTLAIHEIGNGEAPNWAVQSVNIPSRIYDNANVRVTAAVSGWETEEVVRKVSVFLDGRLLASRDVTVPPSGHTAIEFNELPISYGAHRGEVRIDAHDGLPNDDSFPFSIERSDARKVLFLVAGGRSPDSFFYKSALDASVSAGLRVQPDSLGDSANLDLSPYAFVVLNNPGDLEQQTMQHLTEYVSRGGALFIAVGTATARSGTVPIAGNRIDSTSNIQSVGNVSSEILPPGTFDNVAFVATSRIAVKPSDRVLAHFADGSPLLLECAVGEGKILIFDATLDNLSSDFPVHSSFVPFVATTAAYLSGAGDIPSSIAVGDAIALRRAQAQSASADVIGPDGKHEIALSDATRIMTFKPLREGFYDVHPASGRRTLLAVHADRRESNLTRVPAETLILWRNTSNGGASATERAAGTTKLPFSLWRYILTLVLIAAVVESIFATRYLSEERQKI